MSIFLVYSMTSCSSLSSLECQFLAFVREGNYVIYIYIYWLIFLGCEYKYHNGFCLWSNEYASETLLQHMQKTIVREPVALQDLLKRKWNSVLVTFIAKPYWWNIILYFEEGRFRAAGHLFSLGLVRNFANNPYLAASFSMFQAWLKEWMQGWGWPSDS